MAERDEKFDFLVVTHSGSTGTLYFSDLDTSDRNDEQTIPVYLKEGNQNVYVFDDLVAQSYRSGSIQKFEDSGFVSTVLLEKDDIAETQYEEYTYNSDGLVTNVTTWVTSAKQIQTETVDFTYDDLDNLDETVEKQYDPTGTVLKTVTCTYTYNPSGDVVAIDCTET